MAEIVKIGSVPAPSWISGYAANAGVIIGGPSRSQMRLSDSDRVGSGWIAGEALNPDDACFIFAGAVFRCQADNATHVYAGFGTATAIRASTADGFAAGQTQAGEAVTLYGSGVEGAYTTTASSGVLPKPLYVSATVPGGLTDVQPTVTNAANANLLPACAFYMGDGRIRIK